MKHIIVLTFTFLLCLMTTGTVQAVLIDNHDGTITQMRNDGSRLMWSQDADYAYTSGYCATEGNCFRVTAPYGDMRWYQATNWLNYLNDNNYLGYNDWRLPNILPLNGVNYIINPVDDSFDASTDNSWNVTSLQSELGYMFFVKLGNLAWYDINGNPQQNSGLRNTGPFINLRPAPYWSGNEYPLGSGEAWNFHFSAGLQNTRGTAYYVWLVRDITSVPEPSTLLLLGAGLAGVGIVILLKRRQKTK